MSDDLRRFARKYRAVERTKRRLAFQLDSIDWEEDVLLPQLEQFKKEFAETLELPELIVEDED